jgi:hypothetical protein
MTGRPDRRTTEGLRAWVDLHASLYSYLELRLCRCAGFTGGH